MLGICKSLYSSEANNVTCIISQIFIKQHKKSLNLHKPNIQISKKLDQVEIKGKYIRNKEKQN